MLQVDPSEVWLKDECDGSAFFADESGRFTLHGVTPYSTLLVEGPIAVNGLSMRGGFQPTMSRAIAGQTLTSTPPQQTNSTASPGPPMF